MIAPLRRLVALMAPLDTKGPEPAPRPRKRAGTAKKATAVDPEIAALRRKGLKRHKVGNGCDKPRWSPPDFPVPIWSDNDLDRPDPRKFSKSTGNILWIDRRPPALRKGLVSFTIGKTGIVKTKR